MSTIAQPGAEDLRDIEYPSSDGEPMAETPLHVQAIIWLFQAIQHVFASVPDVFIGANNFWYWEKGNPSARRAPDVMVVKGVDRNKPRRSFFTWREGNAIPCVIFEISSEKKWRDDLFVKRRLYAERGVKEYFLFDPEAAYLRPPLLGFRLGERSEYVSLEPDAEDRLYSEELGHFLRVEGSMLRLIDARTGKPVMSHEEVLQEAEAARRRLAELQAEVARLQAQGGTAASGGES